MHEYKFIRINLRTGLFARKPKEDYRIVIEHYAAKGWRLIQIFTPPWLGFGTFKYYDLIFEKQIFDS